jgi:O-succinylbenzoate synthase
VNIESIEIREIAMKRRVAFTSARARVDERRILLVKVKDQDGFEGWGECSSPEEPRYCEEWTNASWEVINNILAPSLLSRPNLPVSGVRKHFEIYRGNRMAKAAIEAACWDLEARRQGMPLWQLLGGNCDPIPCGVALGVMNSINELIDSIERELHSGYLRIKLKIRPGWDVNVVEAVRTRLPHATLMVDANGAYTTDDFDILHALDGFRLLMIEQPFAPDDLCAYREMQGRLQTPICMDETIVSTLSAKAALQFRLCGVVNVKLGRVGGHAEAREIIKLCIQHGIACWSGGQHEAGIGRAHNIAMAALMPRSVPSELSASARYWLEDIIIPEIIVDSSGYLRPPAGPGCGFEVNRELIEAVTSRRVINR